MDIKALAAWLARRSLRVLWFIVRNPFLILRKAFRWGLFALFWLFLLGWGISVFAAEWTPAPSKEIQDTSSPAECSGAGYGAAPGGAIYTPDSCLQWYIARTPSLKPKGDWYFIYSVYRHDLVRASDGADVGSYVQLPARKQTKYVCPPDGKPDFTVGPKVRDGVQVCEKKAVSCNVGEQLFMDAATGAESCKPNCASVAGQKLENVAYNQAFLPSATVSCFGLCTVSSSGLTVGNPKTFEQFGNVQFTGEACPVKFPNEGNGNVIGANPPASSAETAAALAQLQNAASAASGSPVSGATGTATLNDVVNKVAETSNKQVKAMSDQNAALGKVLEGVGKDIQGAIKDSAQGTAAGSSIGQLQTANAIKDGNKKLQEISDKLDKPKDPTPPIAPGTKLNADTKGLHKANDWGTRNFGTVLQANASRFRALPIFSAPTSFFKADISGGSCPSYNGSFSLLGTTNTVQLDAFCSPTVLNVMPYIRAVVIMFFGWLAWRIAVGNWG